MAATLEALKLRLADLKTARDSGVLTVRHGDTMTTFRSMGEIQTGIYALSRDIAELEGVITGQRLRRPRYIVQTSKGY